MLSLTQFYRTWLRSIVVVGGERPEKTFHAGYVSANTEDERVHGQHHDWRDRGERRVDQSVGQCVPKHEQRRRTIVGLFWSVLSSHDSSKTTFYEAFKGQGIL